MTDRLERFLLREAEVRVEIVTLGQAWREVVHRHAAPDAARDRLGELAAAALLLSASLKFDGQLTLQIHGDGPVSLYVVESDAAGRFRATLKLRDAPECTPAAQLGELVNAHGRGRFVVTLNPRGGKGQPYQGIVPFEGESVSTVLEHYMQRSEQVPTRLWLAADGSSAAGLLLQRLPAEGGRGASRGATADPDAWNRVQHLADTITADELLRLAPEQVLRRLFWQERPEAMDSRACEFACSCTRERVAAMLRMLGRDEVESILDERGQIDVHCEFCNTHYRFDPVDAAGLFVPDLQRGSDTLH
ncbi:MAG: Hsp33 family molecular chaperone HslO [Burkholderiales bacterium]|nr:MAG: Hsp33 family molecular chaperone HslO [Burkholderiales bacterium]